MMTHDHISLDDFWPYQAVVLADQISRYTQSIVREESDLNSSQWRVLAAIMDKPGCSGAEVTAVTPMDKTIVSRAVKSLIDAGIVEKLSVGADKRRSSLKATSTGRAIYKKIATRINETLSATFDDQAQTEQLLSTVKAFSLRMTDLSGD